MTEEVDQPRTESTATDDNVAAKGHRAYLLSWIVLLVGVGLIPLFWQGLKHVRLKNDVESWLPSDDPNALGLAWYHKHFEHYETVLVSWDSSSLDDPRVAKFADEVVKIAGVEEATSPSAVIDGMVERRIDRDVALDRLKGVLIGTGGMKVRLTELGRTRSAELIKSISESAENEFGFQVRADIPPDTVNANYDFQLSFPGIGPDSPRTQAMRTLIEQLASASDPKAPLLDDVFFEAGAPVAISITINEVGDESLRPTIAAVKQAAYDVGVGEDELRIGGAPVAGSQLNQAVIHSVENPEYPTWMLWKHAPVLLSVIISVVLAFLMLRSVRLALIVLLVGGYCVMATVSIVPPTGGSMSMVLVVMPNLLMVLTMSGAIHLANYWKHAAADAPAGTPREIPIRHAVKQAKGPCSMASFTTAIGLASLLTSVLTPVKDFGCYSAIGCGLSLIMVLGAVPALLRVWPGRAEAAVESDRTWWLSFGHFIVRHHAVVTTLCIVVGVAASAGLYFFKTETKVIRYFPDESRIIQDYNRLEESLAGIVPVTVIVGFQGEGWAPSDLQDQIGLVRELEEKLEAHPEISGTISLAGFIPPPPDESATRRQVILYNRKVAQAIGDAVESDGEEAGFVARVKESLVTTDRGRAVAFELPTPDEEGEIPLGQEIWKITSQVSIMSEMDYDTFLKQIDEIISTSVDRFQSEQADPEAAGPRDISYIVTGTVPLFLRTQQAVLESLIRSFGLAFGVIAVVMMFVLRGFRAGVITMLPNLLPVGVVFGAVSWYGMAVDIGTMITASVALGVAVDGTLHLISWFRDRLAMGEDPHVAIAEGLTHCGPAMWQTSSIVGFGMLALLGADLLLISRFGGLMAALIAAALVADLVFLPSLLAGPLGRLIAARVRRMPSTSEGEETTLEGPTLRVVGGERTAV